MYFIGIDPGKKGAIAWISEDGKQTGIIEFNEPAYVSVCYQLKGKAKAVLERVGAMPGQGVTSMFSFGENYGFIRGILEAFSIPYELVRPQKWKKEFSVTADKGTSIKVARKLFPGTSLRPSDRCKTDHDGMAEALLIAEYARRHMK